MLKKASVFCAAIVSATSLFSSQASALALIEHGENKSVYITGGLRVSFTALEDAVFGSDTDRSNDTNIDNIRLYLGGQVTEKLFWEFNVENKDDNDVAPGSFALGVESDDVEVLDAIFKYAHSEAVNIWLGRQIISFGRNGISGPFGMNAYDYPISDFSSFSANSGRDDGFQVWGHFPGDVSIGYHVGFFDGSDVPSVKDEENNRISAGIGFNFWDDEGYNPFTGLYFNNTYYGAKDVLHIRYDFINDPDAAGTAANAEDYHSQVLSFLLDKKLSNNAVATLEAAIFDYDAGSAFDGDGYYVRGGYMFAEKFGDGFIRPIFSIEERDIPGVSELEKRTIGAEYVIDGHAAKATLSFGEIEDPSVSGSDRSFIQFGTQLLF